MTSRDECMNMSTKLLEGFTKRYNITWLAYYEETTEVVSAIERENRLKAGGGSKKEALIESLNPRWKDLSLEWYEDVVRHLRFATLSAASSMTARPTCHSEGTA